VQAIGPAYVEEDEEEGFKPYGVEGEEEGQWVLMDYGR